jgi:hypothetical protein
MCGHVQGDDRRSAVWLFGWFFSHTTNRNRYWHCSLQQQHCAPCPSALREFFPRREAREGRKNDEPTILSRLTCLYCTACIHTCGRHRRHDTCIEKRQHFLGALHCVSVSRILVPRTSRYANMGVLISKQQPIESGIILEQQQKTQMQKQQHDCEEVITYQKLPRTRSKGAGWCCAANGAAFAAMCRS